MERSWSDIQRQKRCWGSQTLGKCQQASWYSPTDRSMPALPKLDRRQQLPGEQRGQGAGRWWREGRKKGEQKAGNVHFVKRVMNSLMLYNRFRKLLMKASHCSQVPVGMSEEKVPKRNYQLISPSIRRQLVQMVFQEQIPVYSAAQILSIKYSTAKDIVRKFKAPRLPLHDITPKAASKEKKLFQKTPVPLALEKRPAIDQVLAQKVKSNSLGIQTATLPEIECERQQVAAPFNFFPMPTFQGQYFQPFPSGF